MSDHNEALCINGLRLGFTNFKSLPKQNQIKHSNFYDKFNVRLLISTLRVPIIFKSKTKKKIKTSLRKKSGNSIFVMPN